MHMSEILERQLHALAGTRAYGGLEILETGTIRSADEAHRLGDGWSTLTFAEYVAAFGGRVTSVDLDTSVADEVLRTFGLRDVVALHQGYSVSVLADLLVVNDGRPAYDVILLDSENDPQLILHEFMIAKHLLRPGGLLLVDDVVPGSRDVRKGELLVPYLEHEFPEHAYTLQQRTGGGVHSGVLAVRL